jgi:hypothetical protein
MLSVTARHSIPGGNPSVSRVPRRPEPKPSSASCETDIFIAMPGCARWNRRPWRNAVARTRFSSGRISPDFLAKECTDPCRHGDLVHRKSWLVYLEISARSTQSRARFRLMPFRHGSTPGSRRRLAKWNRHRRFSLGPQNRENLQLRLKHRQLAVTDIRERLQNLLVDRCLRHRDLLHRTLLNRVIAVRGRLT